MIIKIFKNNWFFITLLIISSLFATRALWHSGLWTSHDGPHQVVRLYYYWQSVQDGQFPPRYILQALRGFGYPLFIFSYHLPWILSLPFKITGVSIYDTLKILFILTYLGSGLTMYWWQKKLWSGSAGGLAAFVGAFLYIWAPFRFSDIFVRGALGEAMAFMFVPLIFFSMTVVRQTRRSIPSETRPNRPSEASRAKAGRDYNLQVILGGIGIAGVILSHALIFVLLLLVILAWVAFQLLSHLGNSRLLAPEAQADGGQVKKYLKTVAAGLALGFGLSAFYLLPAFFLKKYTVFSQIMAGNASSFADHFPSLRQLIYSPWGFGFSFSGPNDGMSFQVGIAQWITVALSLFIIVWGIIKFKIQKSKCKVTIKNSKIIIALFFLFIFAFSIFMMLAVSRPIWQLVNKFAYIDYPWRYLFVSTFCASVLAGWLVYMVKLLKSPKLLKVKPEILFGVFLIIIALYTNRNHIKVNLWLDWDPMSFIGEGETSNSFDEYTPLWADRGYIKEKKDTAMILEGNGQISGISRKTSEVVFRADNEIDSRYQVNQFYFPQVTVLIDGQPAGFDYKNKGMLEFSVPQGDHEIKIKWQRTFLEKIGLFITAIAFIMIIAVLVCKATPCKVKTT